jgi:predicted branched-subunit amino acid permease
MRQSNNPRLPMPETTFTAAGFRRGYAQAQPLAIGVFAYAVTFGMLASDAGLSS